MSDSSTVLLSSDEEQLARYDYLNLHSSFNCWPPPTREKVLAETSDKKRLQLILARYAFFHETRHFHDFFGTFAGASLFITYFKALRNFITVLEMAKHTDEDWSIPFCDWAATSKFSDIYSRFLKSWSVQQKAAIRFTGFFSPKAAVKSHAADPVVYLGTNYSENDRIAAFPFDVGIPDKDLRLTVYYPVSLVALLEGNAQAIQRSLSEAEFPDAAGQFTPPKSEHRLIEGLEKDQSEIVASLMQPYNVTDFMLTKYLRLRGRTSFERKSLICLTDITLSSCGIVRRSEDDLGLPHSFEMKELGHGFVSTMESFPVEKLASGDIQYPPILLKAYANLLAGVLDFPKPHEIDYKGDLLSPLNLLESIFRHDVIAPLLQARLDTNHEVFHSVVEYMRRFSSLPKIPVMEHNGGLEFASYMTPLAEDAWSKYVFLKRLCGELANGSHILTCPRATGVIGNTGDTNFCTTGECRDNIHIGNCNGWYRTSPHPLPQCLFAQVLKATGAPTDS